MIDRIDVYSLQPRIVAVPKIVIVPYTERKPQVRQERRNVFSDETNLLLLRYMRGESSLPYTLSNDSAPVPHDLQLELAAAIRQRLLPWFWSISLHIALLILLTLLLFPVRRVEPLDVLSGIANIPAQQESLFQTSVGNGESDAPHAAEDIPTGTPDPQEETLPANVPVHPSPGLNFSGRDVNLRAAMLGGGGGSGQTDEAVLAGLHWLATVQQPNGAWNFSGTFPQSASKDREDALAATAMALLAFQGFGVTPDSREPMLIEFALPVRRGRDWLLRQQNPDGSFFAPSERINSHRFYTHAFCTIALCELLAMTSEETLRDPARQAVDYCVQHQSIRSGGWRYVPDRFSEQSDVSVTGWIVLALKSGQAAGLTVPPEVYDNVMKFLDSMMESKSHQYRYREEEPEPRLAMTAEALLCRILLGWERSDPRLAAGVQGIVDFPPSFVEHYHRDVYYWFFATQVLYHYGGDEWQMWNLAMREQLLQYQEKSGSERGSWNPFRPVRDAWGHQYGRLYTTCMSLYMLEVYYRHLPIFPPIE